MSALSNYAGSGIRSVQSGEISLPYKDSTVSIAVSSVNTSKTMLIYNVKQGNDSSSTGATLVLESSTLLRAKAGNASGGATADPKTLVWQLLEFY